VVYGSVSYKDFFGTPHVTKFCSFWMGGKTEMFLSARKCSDYNSIDKN
jgi:hypothetical protein